MAAPETLEDFAARLVEAAGADGRPDSMAADQGRLLPAVAAVGGDRV